MRYAALALLSLAVAALAFAGNALREELHAPSSAGVPLITLRSDPSPAAKPDRTKAPRVQRKDGRAADRRDAPPSAPRPQPQLQPPQPQPPQPEPPPPSAGGAGTTPTPAPPAPPAPPVSGDDDDDDRDDDDDSDADADDDDDDGGDD